MEFTEHIVRFDEWCEKCEHYKQKEINDPCNTCLDYSTNTNTSRPVLFKDSGQSKTAGRTVKS